MDNNIVTRIIQEVYEKKGLQLTDKQLTKLTEQPIRHMYCTFDTYAAQAGEFTVVVTHCLDDDSLGITLC